MWVLINDETGEMKKIEEGSKIITPKQIDYLKTTIEINSDFVKVFTDNDKLLFDALTTNNKLNVNAIAVMRYLYQFVDYETGILQHENGKPLTVKYLTNNLKMSESTINRSLKLLREKRIISKIKYKKKLYFVFNPFLIANGKRVKDLDNFKNTIFAKNLE